MMKLTALKIDPEFQGKIPPLNAEEEHILEQNMIQERRLLNPLIIWNGYILDGHSRYRMLDNKISHSHSPAVPPDFFSTDATALKMVAILFDNGLITADTYHQVISRYST